ncbi:patatin-like phospholipase family protein [Methylobacterium sp. J-090]|uniref:patatin-like phospholipase family protein n=1 Tax=Methylobacterium sp. J-090 TaxID=2836666 RepID=UPI001FBA269C|nr:patatin-like phospholipase family protein [Methylobacterium sp. J-090]MCJ2081155.1 patatin-like phospholipase family protein [Methylobacterium sp. J-090]
MSGSSIRRTSLRSTALVCVAAIGLGLPQPASAAERTRSSERGAFTAAEAASARPDGLPAGLRIPGDDPAAFARFLEDARAAHDPWLVLSGGGENGAFAAGLLKGWSEAGTRPTFGVITGVSTGAMIAPFAFIGSAGDEALRQGYTEISAADVFEFGGTNESLTDTWPLKRRIDRSVTPKLLQAVAAEHAKGRRLLVATTAVDSERPVLWDMGAIAGTGGPKALALFRDIILASSAVPGVFPPVMVEAVAGSKHIQEMHDDGGTTAPYYLAPEAWLLATHPVPLPTHRVYLVVNNSLAPQFQMASRTTLSVLGRSLSAAIKAQTRAALALSRSFAQRTGLDLQVAEIDGRFTRTTTAPFDQTYMKALFAHGEVLGRNGTAFTGEAQGREAETGTKASDLPAISLAGTGEAQDSAVRDLARR